MDLERLREATAADHLAVEGSVPLMGEGLMEAEYVSCLQRLHGVVSAWEEYVAAKAPEWLRGLGAARQRKTMLERDLAWFGQAQARGERAVLPVMGTDAGVLGAMYVMEGSTLGGQLIARHVSRVLGLSGGEGYSFFRGHGERTGVLWKEFCGVLREQVGDRESEEVIQSAKEMFQVFGLWMRGK